MAFPRTPGGLFPLTTAPTGRNAGGQYPLPAVLSDAIRSLAPTAYWKLDEASGNLADTMSGGYTATVTGSPTYGVAAPSPIGRGVTFSGTGQYATTSGSVPTPSATFSVLGIFQTTNATGAARGLLSRLDTGQNSWTFQVGATHLITFQTLQSDGTTHSVLNISGAVNDGLIHVCGGTWDGTTLTVIRDGVASGSTTVSGTWHKASTAGLGIAQRGVSGSNLFPGTIYRLAYWADRVLTAAEYRWIHSIAMGG